MYFISAYFNISTYGVALGSGNYDFANDQHNNYITLPRDVGICNFRIYFLRWELKSTSTSNVNLYVPFGPSI